VKLRTKVVCTLGPASSDPETIRELVRGGMDLARLNMSHGSFEEHSATVERIRSAAEEVGRPVAILVDLQGPKIRVGFLAEPVELTPGEEVVFAPEGVAAEGEIPTTYTGLGEDLSPGDQVLLDDGLLELACEASDGVRARLRVVRGGVLQSKKGMNLPGVQVREPALTEKDERDLEWALQHEVDYVGLSFVRKAADVEELRTRVEGRALVVAKIEKAQALDAIEEILAVTDAVMVARGDLGVELPFEQVPLAQKWIIQRANAWARPVITATQMLESMIENPRPTRAEASDVANALLDGTDAVMLSGETAVGSYPVRALDAIVRISREIQASGLLDRGPRYQLHVDDLVHVGATPREHAVAAATVESVRQLDAPAIIVITRSGFSARLVSSYRPPVPIFAVCTEPRVRRQLSAVWGVEPVLSTEAEVSYEGLTDFGRRRVLESGTGGPGDSVVVTAGFPFHTSGTTNTLRVERL